METYTTSARYKYIILCELTVLSFFLKRRIEFEITRSVAFRLLLNVENAKAFFVLLASSTHNDKTVFLHVKTGTRRETGPIATEPFFERSWTVFKGRGTSAN